jgi:hypothetical protein
MPQFSVVKSGDSYVIQFNDEGILRCKTKREARKAVTEARKLLSELSNQSSDQSTNQTSRASSLFQKTKTP